MPYVEFPATTGTVVKDKRTEKHNFGDIISLTIDKEKEGYVFAGWYLNDEFLSIERQVTFSMPEFDATISVQWNPIEYTITYLNVENAINDNPMTYSSKTVPLTLNNPISNDGLGFKCWKCNDNEISIINDISLGNITLTAVWSDYVLGDIKYDTNKKYIKENDIINCELFNITCNDIKGGASVIEVTYTGTKSAGNMINVYIKAYNSVDSKEIVISNILVFGTPVVEKKYSELNDKLAIDDVYIVKDSFGNILESTKEYNDLIAGTYVTVYIKATDCVGNILDYYDVAYVYCSEHHLDTNGKCTVCGYSNTIWSGGVASSFAGGNGTLDNPYIISNAEELAYLASETNSGKIFSGYYFKQTKDIDLANINWEPIGKGIDTENPSYSGITFSGTYDGGYHTISNLSIKKSDTSFYGLFGNSNGTIVNLGINDVSIDVSSNNRCMTGALCGFLLSGTVKNCYVRNAVVTGDSINSPCSIGGLIGVIKNGAILSNCYAYNATVTSRCSAGVLISSMYSNHSNIDNCYATGKAVSLGGGSSSALTAGICAYIDNGTVINSFFIGEVSSPSERGTIICDNRGSVSNCYYITSSSITYYTGTAITSRAIFTKDNLMTWMINTMKWNTNEWTLEKSISDICYPEIVGFDK